MATLVINYPNRLASTSSVTVDDAVLEEVTATDIVNAIEDIRVEKYMTEHGLGLLDYWVARERHRIREAIRAYDWHQCGFEPEHIEVVLAIVDDPVNDPRRDNPRPTD